MTIVAQISDLHLGESPRSAERARRVVQHLAGLARPVDALVVTGDIADHGDADEYRLAAEILGELRVPVIACPGNHDVRAPYREHYLGTASSDGPVNVRVDLPGISVLAVDSSIPGRDEGRLDEATLAWLDSELSVHPDRRTLVALHHSPVPLHHPLHDAILLTNPDDLAGILRGAPHVVGLLAGHAHLPAATSFVGVPLRVGPGITWSLRMPWEGDGVADLEQPPAVAFHVLDDLPDATTRLTTHLHVVV